MFLQQLINGIVVGSVYALTAMGATLVYGIMRILDISNAGAYAIGAYTAFFFFAQTGNPVVAFVGGVLFTAGFGYLVQKFLYAPLMDKSPNVSLIAGIGLFIFLQDFLRLIAGPQARELNFGTLLPSYQLPQLQLMLNGTWFVILGATAILLGILWVLMNRLPIGLAWRATAQDLDIAKAMGINTHRVVAFNFIIGYGFAAVAGVLVGILYNSIYPTMGDVPAYKMLAVIVLGGLGSPMGTVLAALVIGMAETLIGGYIGFFLPRDAIAFVVLILILLWRPQGLLGKRRST